MTTALEKITFTDEQVGLIKATICPGYTDNELRLFVSFCGSIGANPLAREVHTWKADGKVIFCRGIDWLRRNAMESSGRCYAPGRTTFVYDAKGGLESATTTVKRWYPEARQWMEAEGTAWFSECNKGNSMWRQRPKSQLAKCSEAQALRQMFPEYMAPGMGISDGNELLVEPEAYPEVIDIPAEHVTEVPDVVPPPVPEPTKRGPGRPRKHAESLPTTPPDFVCARPVEATAEPVSEPDRTGGAMTAPEACPFPGGNPAPLVSVPMPPAAPGKPYDGVEARQRIVDLALAIDAELVAQGLKAGLKDMLPRLKAGCGLPMSWAQCTAELEAKLVDAVEREGMALGWAKPAGDGF